MKILLLGEFSGVHNNLKKGLQDLGHEVKIAANGDGFKKFGYDFKIRPSNNKHIYKIFKSLFFYIHRKKFIGYDIVQFINPIVFPSYFYLLGIPQYIKRNNKRLVYYCCGTDPNYFEAFKILKYHPYDEIIQYSKLNLKYHKWFLDNLDSIIPATYSYYIGYKNYKVVDSPIAFPNSNMKILPLKAIKGKMKILFGIIRRSFKGTEYIEEALKNIELKYAGLVEIKIIEKLPFDEYIKCLEEADIIIDQCRSYSYGMNAIFALEYGLIVLSGAEEEAMDYLGIVDSPIFNIRPDSDHIYSVIESLIKKSSSELMDLKLRGVEHVKKYHGQSKVAKEFEARYIKMLED